MRAFWLIGVMAGLILLTPHVARANRFDVRLNIAVPFCYPAPVRVYAYDEGPYYYEPGPKIIYRPSYPTYRYYCDDRGYDWGWDRHHRRGHHEWRRKHHH
jgi:hypothetical protein